MRDPQTRDAESKGARSEEEGNKGSEAKGIGRRQDKGRESSRAERKSYE